MSAFSTLVESAESSENAQKMRKNVQIRNSLSSPHFPLQWKTRAPKKMLVKININISYYIVGLLTSDVETAK